MNFLSDSLYRLHLVATGTQSRKTDRKILGGSILAAITLQGANAKCLRPTPTDHLPVLSGIQPAELRRMGATVSLAHRESMDPDHILYGLLSGSSDTRQVRLRSRRPFVPAARNLLDNLARLGICASEWTNHKWNAKYCENAFRLLAFVPRTGARDGLTPSSWG